MTVQEMVGARVRDFRKRKGFTLDSFSEKVGLASGKYLGQIERGEINTTLETLDKIAKGLGIAVRDFFPDSEDEITNSIFLELQGKNTKAKKQVLKVVRAMLNDDEE